MGIGQHQGFSNETGEQSLKIAFPGDLFPDMFPAFALAVNSHR
jgi:hypothetical protein